jgi:eukaryotic-like serine/threonine-protein kinase
VRIGPYEILLELGRGGMGAVYLARLSGAGEFERLVAVKRALPQSLADDGTRERFLHEAKLAACVHHANVVGIHQVGSDAVGPYLACDFVEGESLAGLIERAKKENGVPPRVVLRIIVDALAGLAAVHDALDPRGRRLDILHRDVSLENLLVGLDGVTRITDFGIAKSTASPIKTVTGTIHGKLLYLAPEYLAGEDPPDRSCDLYAMGITLFSALTSTYPYPIDDVTVLIEHIHSQPLPSLSSRGVQATPELEAVLQKACHRERPGRFSDAREMLDALERAAQGWLGVARQQEVADFVERVAGEPLRARRAMLTKRSDLPPVLAPVTAGAETRREPERTAKAAQDAWHSVPMLTQEDDRLRPAGLRPAGRPAARRLFLIAGAMLGLGAGVGAFAFRPSPASPAAPAEVAPTAAPALPEPPLSTPSPADVLAPAEPVPDAQRAPLELEMPPVREPDLPPSRSPARTGRGRSAAERPAAPAVTPAAEPASTGPASALPPELKPLDLDAGATGKPGRRAIAVDNPYR